MTAQILNFPNRDNESQTGTAAPAATDYVQVATRLIESAGIRGYDLQRLARAIMAEVARKERELREAAIEQVKRDVGYADASELSVSAKPTTQPEYRVVDKFRGAKYQSGLDVVQIAKLLRKDLAEARKTTLVMLPAHAKISVTTDRYSMGCSITVRIKGLRESEKWIDGDYRNGRTPLCLNVLTACQDLMNAYKRDNSDTRTDYYDVNFSGSVVVD